MKLKRFENIDVDAFIEEDWYEGGLKVEEYKKKLK